MEVAFQTFIGKGHPCAMLREGFEKVPNNLNLGT
jgi:hypothetical protein